MLNIFTAIGNVTHDLELKTLSNSNETTACCDFQIAVSRNTSEVVDFIDCSCFGKTAENLTKHIKKGNRICVEGCLQTRIDKNNIKRYSVKCNHIYYLTAKEKSINIDDEIAAIEIPVSQGE